MQNWQERLPVLIGYTAKVFGHLPMMKKGWKNERIKRENKNLSDPPFQHRTCQPAWYSRRLCARWGAEGRKDVAGALSSGESTA